MGDSDYGVGTTNAALFGSDTVGYKFVGMKNGINTAKVIVNGTGGLALTVYGSINYVVVASNEGADIDEVAEDGGLVDNIPSGTANESRDDFLGAKGLSIVPNPFNPSTAIRFYSKAKATISIYDLTGKRVKTWNAEGRHGMQSIHWDGRNASGGLNGAGVYVVRLLSAGKTHESRITFLK
jgi:hypothetical protein